MTPAQHIEDLQQRREAVYRTIQRLNGQRGVNEARGEMKALTRELMKAEREAHEH